MNWLEQKYIGLLSSRLRNFKRKSGTLYNFSCPFCGDSHSNSKKARGYIYDKSGKSIYHCHNCGVTYSFSNFLKLVDTSLYQEYSIEKISDNKNVQDDFDKFVEKMKKPVFMQSGPLKGLKKVSQLHHDDPIKKFVVSRKIPNEFHAKLFACPNFNRFVNNLLPNKFSERSLDFDETRLLIPFLDANKSVHAFQGRSLNNRGPKYITIILNEHVPKVFNLDKANFGRDVSVVEGPIDSMFLSNSIATAGGDLVSAVGSFNKDNLTIVYDNEPRSKETVKKLDKAIMNGYKVCIWPENFEHKDINDAVIAGLTPEFIQYIIKQNTYKDLAAKLALQKWSKV